MKFIQKLPKLQSILILLLVCSSGALGYLYYDSYKTNIEDRQSIKQISEDNLDISQDISILKDKNEKLNMELSILKGKVAKVSYKKKYHKQKFISSAGKSSKNKHYSKRNNVNYKKLYFELKNKCIKHNSSRKHLHK